MRRLAGGAEGSGAGTKAGSTPWAGDWCWGSGGDDDGPASSTSPSSPANQSLVARRMGLEVRGRTVDLEGDG